MPNVNPTTHNHLANSVEFNSTVSIGFPHGVDTEGRLTEFAHIPTFPTTFDLTPPFSIHVWVKFDRLASIRSRIITTPIRGAGITTAFMLGLLGDEVFYGTNKNALRVGMGIDPDGTQAVKVTREPVIRPDMWHYIVGNVVNTTSIDIYVDGCKRDVVDHKDINYTQVTNTGNTTPTGLVVGWDPNLEAPLKGNLASLAIFNRLLTAEEIETLAQGPCNLTGTSFNLKSVMLAWWKMGDGDPVGLATLNDSVGTNHLTTINMSASNLLTDVPKELPRKHQHLHISTGADVFDIDPNGVGCPFLWDSFLTITDEDVAPLGWFIDPAKKEATDKFHRINVAGRMSVLRLSKISSTGVLYITNLDVGAATGSNTMLFGHPADPDPTEYSMELVMRYSGNTENGDCFFGFVENPHAFTEATNPATGVYVKFNGTGGTFLIVADSTNEQTNTLNTLTRNVFHRIKITMSYHPDLVQTAALRVRVTIDGGSGATRTVLSNSTAYPTGTADIFLGVYEEVGGGPINMDIEWISVSHRSIGAESVLDL